LAAMASPSVRAPAAAAAMPRRRRNAVGAALLLAAGAAVAAVASASAFVAGSAPRSVAPSSPASAREVESRVAMEASGKKGWPPGNLIDSAALKAAVKEKQARIMKDKAARKSGGGGKKKGKIQWPAEKEDGITLMHIEYDDQYAEAGARGVVMSRLEGLYKAANTRFGGKVRLLANFKKALQEYSPTGNARPGSFEVIDVHNKKRVYSQLVTGQYPLEDEASLSYLLDKMAAVVA